MPSNPGQEGKSKVSQPCGMEEVSITLSIPRMWGRRPHYIRFTNLAPAETKQILENDYRLLQAQSRSSPNTATVLDADIFDRED